MTPDQTHPSIVWVVVSWELCWYRYEVDLSDAQGHARLDGQGYELSELPTTSWWGTPARTTAAR